MASLFLLAGLSPAALAPVSLAHHLQARHAARVPDLRRRRRLRRRSPPPARHSQPRQALLRHRAGRGSQRMGTRLRPLPNPRRGATPRRNASAMVELASGFARSPRCRCRRSRSRTPPCSRRAVSRPLTRRGGCPAVPIPEPFSPTFGALDQAHTTPFGGLALTPNASLMRGAPQEVTD